MSASSTKRPQPTNSRRPPASGTTTSAETKNTTTATTSNSKAPAATSSHLRLAAKAALAAAGFALSCWLEFGVVYLLLLGFYLVLTNMDGRGSGDNSDNKKKKRVSAYSVFNEGGYRLPGSTDAAQIDRQIRNTAATAPLGDGGADDSDDDFALVEEDDAGGNPGRFIEPPGRLGKVANKACPCGSGKKFKRCCQDNAEKRRLRAEEHRRWEQEWVPRR